MADAGGTAVQGVRAAMRVTTTATFAVAMLVLFASLARAQSPDPTPQRSISALKPVVTFAIGKTADWVAITPDAVWVGSTGPEAVHHIDPKTNAILASVMLPGEPCAGLAAGFGSLWVPLCGKPDALARVDLKSNRLTATLKVASVSSEGGITASDDSVWLVVGQGGMLARLDPSSGAVRQTIALPPGSFNPLYSDGVVWITRVDGAEVTSVDARTGVVLGTTPTGPRPRFLTAGGGAIWTLNQGDGSLTQIDAKTRRALKTIPLGTPGHGGDIKFANGEVWTTMMKVPLSRIDAKAVALRCQWVGSGGDSLGVGHGSIWLTNYHGGTVSRIGLTDARTCAAK
jgi:virginiamycin B lyase